MERKDVHKSKFMNSTDPTQAINNDIKSESFYFLQLELKEHQQWVLDLATSLRDNGVDAILDKWDLKEGQDFIAFMEQMVSDPNVTKVIVVLDKRMQKKPMEGAEELEPKRKSLHRKSTRASIKTSSLV